MTAPIDALRCEQWLAFLRSLDETQLRVVASFYARYTPPAQAAIKIVLRERGV